jgi:hypothetical protein
MRAFEHAVYRLGLKALECDVSLFSYLLISIQIWLTKDDKLIIIHGGDNGELPHLADESGPTNA